MTSPARLLRQIQESAVSSSVPVTDLLRLCKVLAVRLGIGDMSRWVDFELNGYPSKDELPDYRIADGMAKGHFLGPLGSSMSNAPIPASCLPENVRDWARRAYLTQPLAALEVVAKDPHKAKPHCPWPGDLIVLVGQDIYQNQTLVQAWTEIPTTCFVSAVDSVRNRILSFALELESQMPPSDSEDAPAEIPRDRAAHVFHTNIYGQVGNLAQGSSEVTQTIGVAAGDLPALLQAVRGLSVPEEDVVELQEAIKVDGDKPRAKIGPRVKAWLGKITGVAATGAGKVAVGVATHVLPKLLAHYYGFPDAKP